MSLPCTINGERCELEVHPARNLLDLLREDLRLTGAKRGCESGMCGACTVLVDGMNVKACLTLAIQIRQRQVTTIEGLADEGDGLHPIQEAFVENGALQCGYCTAGFIMTTKALLDSGEELTDEQVRAALSGNLCRCTGYVGIVRAVRQAGSPPAASPS
jgi:carbon-monoxide dehydrogenase small subunit